LELARRSADRPIARRVSQVVMSRSGAISAEIPLAA